MLDIKECTNSEVQKHPVSSNQNPVSIRTNKDFHSNGVDRIRNFCNWSVDAQPFDQDSPVFRG
jgi:hypothetical protein